MRLLEKKQIETMKASEKKLDIDQAVRLAQRTDTLRQTVAQEEANLTKFRNETVKKIQGDIDVLTEKKNVLEKDIRDLEEKRRLALLPITEEERRATFKISELKKLEFELGNKKSQVDKLEKDIEARYIVLEAEEDTIKYERGLADARLSEANSNLLDSRDIKAQIVQDQVRARDYFIQRNTEIDGREGNLVVREKNVDLKEAHFKVVEKAQADKERQIADKYQTLQKTLKRLGRVGINL